MTSTASEKLYRCLKEKGLDFFVTVPCRFLSDLILRLEGDAEMTSMPVTREEEGLGILAGAYLSGKRPAIVLQNSGLGNCVNAICSLLNYYEIPVIFIISHRGGDLEKVDAQKPMGRATEDLLKAVNIPFHKLKGLHDIDGVGSCIEETFHKQRSAAILIEPGYWGCS